MKAINQDNGKHWHAYNGDCVEIVGALPDACVGLSVFSPPFASLYTYSNNERDMGNCANHEEFFAHFGFLVRELFRTTKPGRCCSVHCMDLPTSKTRDGYIGISDFSGDVIRSFQREGWIYASKATIWKDPVTAMQRTKALGLLHKQIVKDSCMSRQGIPDYLVTFRKPGDNPEPVAGELDYFAGDKSTFTSVGRLSIDIWQRYASPVWTDINQSNTLEFRMAREEKDERHVCPLQLDVIERAVQLWSNPGDVVLSPFMGIGSEGHVALERDRKFIGVELKASYYARAVEVLELTEKEKQSEFLLND